MGLGKRSHHSNLLCALRVPSIEDIIKQRTLSLYYRSFQVESPLRRILISQLSKYMVTGIRYTGTLVSRLIDYGLSPMEHSYFKPFWGKTCRYNVGSSGIVASLQQLVFSDNYFKPWSAEHILTALLTRSF